MSGRTPRPPRLLVYGTPGIGKSTMGSQAPNPVFVRTKSSLTPARRQLVERLQQLNFGHVKWLPVRGGERILRTVGGPSCVAKNRYGLTEELPWGWNIISISVSPTPSPCVRVPPVSAGRLSVPRTE